MRNLFHRARVSRRSSPFRSLRPIPGTAIAALLGSLLLAGCGGGSTPYTPGSPVNPGTSSSLPSAVAEAQRTAAPVDTRIVAADNTFGFRLFDALRKTDAGKNVFVSPTSLALALQIAYNGAAGETQSGMAQALALSGLSVADVNSQNAALQASLVSPDPQVQVVIANSLWTGKIPIRAEFVTANTTYYGSQLGDLAGAPDNVNAWVSNKTNGKITNLLPQRDYSNDTAILANAVYFKGAWTTPFEAYATQNGDFTLADGSKVSVPLMHRTGAYGYYAGDNFQMARLPYGAGRVSMIVVVPNAGTGLEAVLDKLTPESWNTWVAGLKEDSVDLTLPKFKSEYSRSVKGTLSALGMDRAFSDAADFSNLTPRSSKISDVFHKTFVEVNEVGTEAAAGTGVVIVPTSVAVGKYTVTLDRPFLYAIRDDKTGTILFVGRLSDPR